MILPPDFHILAVKQFWGDGRNEPAPTARVSEVPQSREIIRITMELQALAEVALLFTSTLLSNFLPLPWISTSGTEKHRVLSELSAVNSDINTP